MDLRQLLYFSTLAETLNFRRAAERLNMSQPPLTVAIRKLEDELGAPLFTRNARGVTLTAAGEAALPSARAALAQADQVRSAAREGLMGERGKLTLGYVSSAMYAMLPRLISLYRRQYPEVELVLEEATSVEILERLALRQMDVGLVRLPLLQPALVDTSVVEIDELVAALPETSALAQRDRVSLRLLGCQPFITFPRTSVLYATTVMACHQAGFTPQVAQHADQVHTIMSLVQSGLGVALVPFKATRYVPEGVKLLRLAEPARIEMGLVILREEASALARNFRAVALANSDTECISIS